MPAPESRPSGFLPMGPRSAPCNIERTGGHRTGGSDGRGHGYRSEEPSLPSPQREPRWERPPLSRPTGHEEQMEHLYDRPRIGQVERDDLPSSSVSSLGYPNRRNEDGRSEPSSTYEAFGSMAPCWRLLERANAYMDKVRTLYNTVMQKMLLHIGFFLIACNLHIQQCW